MHSILVDQQRHHSRFTCLAGGLFFVFLFLNPSFAVSQESSAVSVQSNPDWAAGQVVYETNCARCHGPTGAGDGRDADKMFPRPRNLAEGIFKFRTTASGSPPTDQDLFDTISRGLPGSRMPEFVRLPEENRWQLITYIKSLSPLFQDQKPEPISLGKDPSADKADLHKGKKLYVDLGCVACHGTIGRADGPSAATLVDNWEKPIRPADLTKGWSYRSGNSPRDIQARLLAGIDGTPMPSYLDAVSADETWHLSYYVASLKEKTNFSSKIQAQPVSGPLPLEPTDPLWEQAPRTDLLLNGNFYRNGELVPTTVDAAIVQAMYNETEVRLRLIWNDPSESKETPSDAAAVVLLPDRRSKWEVGSLRIWPHTQTSSLESLTWTANQPRSSEVKAVYADGQWRAVFSRPRKGETEPILLGIAVWDGSNGEQDRHRSNSLWLDLILNNE